MERRGGGVIGGEGEKERERYKQEIGERSWILSQKW